MENIFETLGGILRPETKKQFNIIETTAEHCRGYNRATKGREVIAQVEASSPSEALEKWLSNQSESYRISRVSETYRSGFVKDSDPERYIWQDGDTWADFGDFTVSAGIMPHYKIEISFSSDRPLTAEELNSIVSGMYAEVEEPHNYSTLRKIDVTTSNIQHKIA